MRGAGRGGFGVHAVEESLTRDEARGVLRRLARMLRPWRGRVVGSVGLLVGQTACLLAGPALVAYGIDSGLRANDPGALNLAALAYLCVAVAALFFGRASIWAIARIGEQFLRDLRVRVFHHLLTLGLDFYERERTGRLVSRLTSDVDALQELVQQGLAMFVQNALLVLRRRHRDLRAELAARLVHPGPRAADRPRDQVVSPGGEPRVPRGAGAHRREPDDAAGGSGGRARRPGVRARALVRRPLPRDERGPVRRQPRDSQDLDQVLPVHRVLRRRRCGDDRRHRRPLRRPGRSSPSARSQRSSST